MNSAQLRKEFLSFFAGKDHAVRPSDALVPSQDPTLLFTTAGMVQFKKLWAGSPLTFKRAATVQKCLRAGGKGSDLENVGKTIRHHTFFEMLGNFSFGDYFKDEAIAWAWEFISKVLKMPRERLFVSVYQNDDEALEIWHRKMGFPLDRIVRLGDKDNFWGPAGESGACGPCSEIYYDLGPARGCGQPGCKPGCDCERYLEFWNLVFPQFFQHPDGSRTPLERRGIDTGMGLERLCLLMQGVGSNFETDLFSPIIREIGRLSNLSYEGARRGAFNVIADHTRALTMTFAENILPSNEGRGYVLRRILRRAVRFGRKLDIHEPFLNKLVPVVIDVMKPAYPELADACAHVQGIVESEETRFGHTLASGLAMLNETLDRVRAQSAKTISGDDMFRLYDTYGFPLDFMEDIASDEGFALDTPGFEQAMQRQKTAGKSSWKGSAAKTEVYARLLTRARPTEFTGYAQDQTQATVAGLVAGGQLAEACSAGDVEVVLDRTPFYAESGGQVGDTGVIESPSCRIRVTDTRKTQEGLFLHVGTVESGTVKTGEPVTARVDAERRGQTRRHHTAAHLLQAALREVLGQHVKQAGSYVDEARTRFDFSHFKAVSADELARIEDWVNRRILEDREVSTTVTTTDQARAMGAIALFGEKYGDSVRMVGVDSVSLELCGGTHVKRTGEIGLCLITGETSVAAGIRRIEAVCGLAACQRARGGLELRDRLAQSLSCAADQVSERVEALVQETKRLAKALDESRLKAAGSAMDGLLSGGQTVGGARLYSGVWDDLDAGMLRQMADQVKPRVESGVVLLAAKTADKVAWLAWVSPDLVKQGYHAGQIVKEAALATGGSGGGKPDLAQAGGKNPAAIPQGLDAARKWLQAKVKS